MKIGTRLTLRYTGFTAAVFLLLVAAIYLFSERNRSNEFFRDLKKESITKATFSSTTGWMPRPCSPFTSTTAEFINEVEVAIYDTTFHLLYHDAKQIDLVKDDP